MSYVIPEPIRIHVTAGPTSCACSCSCSPRPPRDDQPILEEVGGDYDSDDWGSVQRWRRRERP